METEAETRDLKVRLDEVRLADEVRSGMWDDYLDGLRAVIDAREGAVRRARVGSIMVGTRVRLNDKTRPRYLVGASGSVTKVNDATVRVEFDAWQDMGRFRGQTSIRCPKSLIEVL